jgi:hypothetical protein
MFPGRTWRRTCASCRYAEPVQEASTLRHHPLPLRQPPWPQRQGRLQSRARALIEPTSEARYRIQLNASASLKEKLELFQALVSHSIPNGDIAAVLERALDLALEQVQKQRFAKTGKPRNLQKPRKPRALKLRSRSSQREHIPNAVQREVATRDGLRCSYVSDDGCRCSARSFLQIHHDHPWARGGTPIAENLRLLCALHTPSGVSKRVNRLLAERDFGAAHVARRIAARRGRDPQPTAVDAAAPNVRREVPTDTTTPPSPD